MKVATQINDYEIVEHRHRYCTWAAGHAANTKTCRFSVSTGKAIIEATGLHLLLAGPELLPPPERIDAQHKIWRELAIEAAKSKGLVGFGHGVAAKLINVYLKGAFVCGGQELHPHVQALHPPIDKLLLDELYHQDIGALKAVWRQARKQRWSKLDTEQYQAVINGIRDALQGKPLWHIEFYWRGHQ
ncbi:hypothetical protein NJH78_21770 [Pseudomonas chlororaphis]|uniref:hypothetical protein n=1 Tax=Pseudomonas chlororaphis TaxID=587753 RepID=UPI0002E4061A|nr:hypothetical protein [Pseudomonas chlororaphis]MCO7572623.1 hypothetical protein [Pseudomonas chlororaphis]MCO7590659.1 hypothetical protein [Pseudomonas chlororaphis]MCO7612852.1 hypothetical protein [Pseudomonas chlororaphis]RBJ77718.1 hypothetical protein C3L29_029890 [Pseudomonas sp. MWU12-2534b]